MCFRFCLNLAKALRRETEQSAIGGDGCVIVPIKTKNVLTIHQNVWQGRRDSNTQPAVLETAALPIEPLP